MPNIRTPALDKRLVQLTSAIAFAGARCGDDPRFVRQAAATMLPKLVSLLADQTSLVLDLAVTGAGAAIVVDGEIDAWVAETPDDPSVLLADAAHEMLRTLLAYEDELHRIGDVVASAGLDAQRAVSRGLIDLIRLRLEALPR